MWLDLWSRSRVELGLSSDQFFELQPRQLRALFDCRPRRERELDQYFAVLDSLIVNWSRWAPEEPIDPARFLLYPPAAPRRRHSARDFAKQMERTMERAMRYQAGQSAPGIV